MTCQTCGKVLNQRDSEYSYWKWHHYFCLEHSPLTTHQDPYRIKQENARIASEQTYLKKDPELLNLPF